LKVFVAVPCYDGTVGVETVRSLFDEQAVGMGAGVEVATAFLPGCSLISVARNELAQQFMDSDSDVMVFVDSDVSWDAGDLIRLATRPVDLVGGAYRLKKSEEAYPVAWLDRAELWAENGLLEVKHIPTGFMAIKRPVFEAFQKKYPERKYTNQGRKAFCYFHCPYEDGILWGEDSRFCHEWREMGGKVWLDPELSLLHTGGQQYFPGHIGKWLKGRT